MKNQVGNLAPAGLPDEIVQHTGEIQCIECMGSRKHCFRIISSEGKAYALKKTYLHPQRVRDYQAICRENVPGFQKVLAFSKADREDEYWVLSEWTDGEAVHPLPLLIHHEEQKKQVQQIAEKIKRIHTDYRTDNPVRLQEGIIRETLARSLTDQNTRTMLQSYMTDRLPLIQARHCTIVHGDFHLQNMIVREDHDIAFIDMDDVRYGDPYIDLVYAANLVYSMKEYYTYYLLLNEYFDRNIPAEFWPVVNFYSIIKNIHIMDDEAVNKVEGRPKMTMDGFIRQHRGLTSEQPLWYTRMHRIFGKHI